jgi:hypothetical protein
MPSDNSVAMPAVALMIPWGGGPAIGLDHQRHVGRLHRDLHVVEADLREVGELTLRRLHQRFGRRAVVLLVELGIE